MTLSISSKAKAPNRAPRNSKHPLASRGVIEVPFIPATADDPAARPRCVALFNVLYVLRAPLKVRGAIGMRRV